MSVLSLFLPKCIGLKDYYAATHFQGFWDYSCNTFWFIWQTLILLCCLCEVLIRSLQRRCPVGLAICSFPAGPDIQVTQGTHPVDILANQGTNLIRHHLFELRCRVGGFKGSIPPQNQVGSSISTRELGKQPNWHFKQRSSALPYRVAPTQP